MECAIGCKIFYQLIVYDFVKRKLFEEFLPHGDQRLIGVI
jgi:hypothetical protein